MKWLQELLGEPPGASASVVNSAGPASVATGEPQPDLPPSSDRGVESASPPPAVASETEAPPVASVPETSDASPVAETAPASVAPDLAAVGPAIVERLSQLVASQQQLQALFDSRIHSDEVQGKSVERLSDELRDYKANFIRQQMQPLLKELIFCYDFVTNEVQRLRSPEPTGNADPLRSLDMLGQMLMDVLFKYDVEPYRGEGDQFDPKVQQCSRTVPTEVEEQDKKIASAGATGFQSPTGIIRREQVTVYKFRPAAK